MSAAAVLGIVLIIGFVGVALVACIAWRHRMRESMPYGDCARLCLTMPGTHRNGTRVPKRRRD